MAFVLGTAVGPTDAAAATSMARRLGLPRRLVTILEGEALFNDGAAIVLYTAAVAAATSGTFDAPHALGEIVYASAAGTAIGLAVGVGGRALRNRIDDPPIEIAGSMLMAYIAYLPAEALHASGVLAAVSAGCIWLAQRRQRLLRAQPAAVQRVLGDARLPHQRGALRRRRALLPHLHRAGARPRGTAGAHRDHGRGGGDRHPAGLDGGDRLADATAAPRAPDDQDAPDQAGWRPRLVIGWAGMRGAITLALLLAVPLTTDAGRPWRGATTSSTSGSP